MTAPNAVQASIGRLFDILDELTAGTITPVKPEARISVKQKLRRELMEKIKPRRRRV